MVATGDDAERLRLGQEILAVHDENVFMIGTVTAPFLPTVVNTSLGNVYQETVSSYRVHNEGVTAFEQVFYRNA
jgi:peptide/nickel transport system substrate-binding protein